MKLKFHITYFDHVMAGLPIKLIGEDASFKDGFFYFIGTPYVINANQIAAIHWEKIDEDDS